MYLHLIPNIYFHLSPPESYMYTLLWGHLKKACVWSSQLPPLGISYQATLETPMENV